MLKLLTCEKEWLFESVVKSPLSQIILRSGHDVPKGLEFVVRGFQVSVLPPFSGNSLSMF